MTHVRNSASAPPPSLVRNPLSLVLGLIVFAVLISRIALPGTSDEEARALQVGATIGTVLGLVITACAVALRRRAAALNAVVLSPLLLALAGALVVEAAGPATGTGATVAAWMGSARTALSFGALTLEDLAVFTAAFWVIAAFFVHATCEDRPRVALLAPMTGLIALALIDQRPAPAVHVATDVSLVAGLLVAAALDERRRPVFRLRSTRTRATTSRSAALTAVVTSAFAASAVAVALVVAAFAGTARAPIDLLPPGIGASAGPATYEPFVDIHQQLVELSDRRLLTVSYADAAHTGEYLVLQRLPLFTGEGFEAGPGDEATLGTGRIAHTVSIEDLTGSAPAVSGPLEASRPIDDGGLVGTVGPGAGYSVVSAGTVRPGLDPPDESVPDPPSTTLDLTGLDGFFPIRERAAALAGAGSPGEQMARIEAHFRSDPSRYLIPERRIDVDLESFVLDDEATGYCEQFAIAMAVMARSIGIPARVVTGFVPGTVNGNAVTVTGSDAHAWVEGWIEGFGWIPFDPTPRGGRAVSVGYRFPEADTVAEETPAEAIASPAAPDPAPTETGPAVWVGIAALAALLGLLWFGGALNKREMVRRAEEGDVAAAWEVTMLRLDAYGRPALPSQTPLEVAAGTTDRMRPLAAAYTKSAYGAAALDEEERSAATASMVATGEELRRSATLLQRSRAGALRSRRPR